MATESRPVDSVSDSESLPAGQPEAAALLPLEADTQCLTLAHSLLQEPGEEEPIEFRVWISLEDAERWGVHTLPEVLHLLFPQP